MDAGKREHVRRVRLDRGDVLVASVKIKVTIEDTLTDQSIEFKELMDKEDYARIEYLDRETGSYYDAAMGYLGERVLVTIEEVK